MFNYINNYLLWPRQRSNTVYDFRVIYIFEVGIWIVFFQRDYYTFDYKGISNVNLPLGICDSNTQSHWTKEVSLGGAFYAPELMIWVTGSRRSRILRAGSCSTAVMRRGV